jgi:hypothetical protein
MQGAALHIRKIMAPLGIGLGIALCAQGPAQAQLEPLVLPVGNAELTLNGSAEGALFAPTQPGNKANASGILRVSPSLSRMYDSGFSWSLNATLAASDPLSRGRYDGDVLEKAYAETRLLLIPIKVGMVDGAAANLQVTGPRAGQALDDAQSIFFRDPSGRAVTNIFAPRTALTSSANYAKILVESPTLFGVTLAFSFTPSEGKNVLPWLAAGPQANGRQSTIWEGALRYSDDFGPLTMSGYFGGAFGAAERKLPGQQGVSEFGLGARSDYHVDDDFTLSLGGSWRKSNAHAFDNHRAYTGSDTRQMDVSAGASYGSWSAALEYTNGVAETVAGLPRLSFNGTQASLRYAFDDSLAISTGWQRLGYDRSAGTFFNGARQLEMRAFFVKLHLNTTAP